MQDPTREGGARAALDPIEQLTVAVARGRDAGALIELAAGETASVGTAEDNDLRLHDPTVSRYHLELSPTKSGVRVTDLDSTNGTFVGAVRVYSASIPRGSQLRIGDTTIVVDASAGAERPPASEEPLPGMVIASEGMRELARRVRIIAKQSSAVLIQGETGSGKELVTRAIHDLGPHATGPFVVVDCGALPAALLEAELFGHEKGAFTSAERARAGAFERADGGSIFLDEIGELPSAAQAALLGVLERQRFRRVGGDREQSVSVRVLSATNRDLRMEVNRGTFRADLYYRLAAARVVIPPLRERAGEVSVLARHFARELSGTEDALDAETLAALEKQSWPGNVRELRAAVERVMAFGMAELGGDAPPPLLPDDAEITRYRDAKATAIAAFDRGYLTHLLAASKNNVSEAARRAQMDRPYLIALLKRHGIR
ncbi:MAG: sigma 54-interacting transcriptional regulator [Myxococcales bacterium]|nr:sigma 54-interacting transcriptional regulator [Myxococcales bacterium]